jgi:hypothetical protein
MQDNSIHIVCMQNQHELVLKKVIPEGKHTMTIKSYKTDGSIYSFLVHVSNKYVLALTELGRVEIHE